MHKRQYILAFVFTGMSVTAVPRNDDIKNDYKTVIQQLNLIKKCYLNKVQCTALEQDKARQALKNSGIILGGLIVTLFSIKWLRGKYYGMQQDLSRSKKGNVKPVSEIPLPALASEKAVEDFVQKFFFPYHRFLIDIEVKNDTLKIKHKFHNVSYDIGSILRTLNAKYPHITKLEEYDKLSNRLNAIEMPKQEPQSKESKQPMYSSSPDLLSKIYMTRAIHSLQKYIVDKLGIDPTSTVFSVELVGGDQGIFVVRSLEEIPKNIQQLFNEMHIKYPKYKYLFIGPSEVEYKIFTAEKLF